MISAARLQTGDAGSLISVIVPALNEEGHIGACIESVSADGGCEIIVADGGSEDATCAVAAAYKNVRVIKTSKGRGAQMNRGAAYAAGEVLLFLHADTILEKGWSRDVAAVLKDEGVAGGAFTFRIDRPELHYRLIETWVKLRCALLRLPYGDQGIFVRRRIFDLLGGYLEIPLMEDVDIVGRIKEKGEIRILGKSASTHHRKWETDGWIRRSFRNQQIMLLYRLGVDPKKLFELYYS